MEKRRIREVFELIIIFFIFSFGGWIWEFIYDLLNTGSIANHGVFHGPWLPIYGSGCILIYLLLNRYKANPMVIFMGAFVLCTTIEYATGWYLETYLHHRWWTYYDMPFNIKGRVCLLSSVFFGLAGLFGIYFAIPKLKKFLSKYSFKKVMIVTLILISLFLIDVVYSNKHPNILKKHKVIEPIKIEQKK